MTKKIKSNSKNKDSVLRVSIPTNLKTWIVAQAATQKTTQAEFVSKVLLEAQQREGLDLKDQIRAVVQEEIKKLRKSLIEVLDKGREVANRVVETPLKAVKEFQKSHH